MRVAVLLLVAAATICAAREKCSDVYLKTKCHSTNREVYLECAVRHRRSLGCENSCEDTNSCDTSCDECDCDSCYGCSYTCSSCCSSCCQAHTTCRTNHCCHKACRSTCRSSGCRDSCNRTCYDNVKHDSTSSRSSSSTANNTIFNSNKSLHNVTTVIHLNNVVNNTNIIDAPIKINTTSLNNISLPASWTLGGGYQGYQGYQENCCKVLSPRQCASTDTFPFVKCWHYRYKMCGDICYSSIMHTYHQQQCQQGSCQQRLVYVPQPSPNCAHNQPWPYVSCGRPQGVNCEGCYGHHFGQAKTSCNSFCYDDGYGVGPYYRQGPFYQPAYSPYPPCQMTGTCGMFGNFYGYQPNMMGGYMPGFNMGYMPAALPYPSPMYGNAPMGYAPNMGAVPYPPDVDGYQPPTYQAENSSRTENASISGPFIVEDPVLYNPYNLYPNAIPMDNITRYPQILAEITPDQSSRYAEIKIETSKDEDNSI